MQHHESALFATGPYEVERMDDPSQPKAIRKVQADEFDCEVQNIIHFNRKGYYDGAFKGMIDNKVVKKYGLLIKPTPTLVWSERLWLNALRMTGKFVLSNKLMMAKRYYKESTHAQWKYTNQAYVDGAITMAAYGEKLIPDHETREILNKSFMEHALSMATA
jgi:CRISPR/Cas system CMR-associated protein Cmr5 small subunit